MGKREGGNINIDVMFCGHCSVANPSSSETKDLFATRILTFIQRIELTAKTEVAILWQIPHFKRANGKVDPRKAKEWMNRAAAQWPNPPLSGANKNAFTDPQQNVWLRVLFLDDINWAGSSSQNHVDDLFPLSMQTCPVLTIPLSRQAFCTRCRSPKVNKESRQDVSRACWDSPGHSLLYPSAPLDITTVVNAAITKPCRLDIFACGLKTGFPIQVLTPKTLCQLWTLAQY